MTESYCTEVMILLSSQYKIKTKLSLPFEVICLLGNYVCAYVLNEIVQLKKQAVL